MKRGNTALKRGVGLASAFALAIAGAVIAAPAANAWNAALTNSIRATPAVDAPYMESPVNYGAAYDATHTTTVPSLVVGQNAQKANGLQVKLPLNGTAPGWVDGDKVVVTLSGGVTGSKVAFTNVPTTISLSKKPVVATSLDSKAGFAGTNATVGLAGTGVGLADNTVVGSLSAGNQVLTITLPNPAGAAAAAVGDVYLLSIDGVTLNVPADQPTQPVTGGAVTAALTTTGTAPFSVATTNTATIAYVSSLKLALDGDASQVGTTVTLPPLVVAEGAVDALAAAGGTFTITASGTDPSGGSAVALGATGDKDAVATASVKGTGGTNPVAASDFNGATGVLTYGASAAGSLESVVISGLQVTNVKAGTDLTISIGAPVAASGDASTFSHVAAQKAQASVVVKAAESLPRIAGANRYATAGDIAQTLGVANGAVIIANGEDAKLGIDALSANFLAGVKGAPILLTQANTLSPDTKAALTKLFKSSTAHITVYVMGKTDSVSQAVRDEIVSTIKATAVSAIATVTVTEVAGDDRYETSVKTLAAAGGSTSASYYDLGKGNLRTAFLASGQTNADALAAGAVSADASIPVLLTSNGKALPESVKAAIAANGIKQVIVLGSTDRVSQDVEDSLKAEGVNVLRLAGTGSNGRFDTAVQIATLDRKAPTDGTGKATGATVYIANGVDGWADALAAGPLVGKNHNSLITVGNTTGLPVSATLFVSNTAALTGVVGLGGKDRVADSVITQAQGLL